MNSKSAEGGAIMKVIIPLAGKGTRLRPHTHTKAKPLFHVAGNSVLGHILDDIKENKDIEEIIFIVGYLGDQIENYVRKNYPQFKSTFVEQKELKGQAHAIKLAQPYINTDDQVVIWFVDTISDAKLEDLNKVEEDGAIFLKRVDDPRRFGQHKVDDNGIIIQNKEKADPPISDLVNIGLYYVKNSKLMFECIDELIEKNMQTKGEFFLMDAFQIMMDKGAKFRALEINVWEDCGKPDAILKTNKYFLDNGRTKKEEGKNSLIIPPVYIEDNVEINDSVIGPYVSVAEGSKINGCIVRNSIVGKDSDICNTNIEESLVGDEAEVVSKSKKLNVGDNSKLREV